MAASLLQALSAGGAGAAAEATPLLRSLGEVCAGLADEAGDQEAAAAQADMEAGDDGGERGAGLARASAAYSAAAEAAIGVAIRCALRRAARRGTLQLPRGALV